MSNYITDIQLSGVTYTLSAQTSGGSGGTEVVELTQAQYDALPSSAKTDASKLYVITDAEEINANDYVTKASNVASGLTVTNEQTSPWEYIRNVSEFYVSADTNCSYVSVYYSLLNYGCCWYPQFDFQNIPTFDQDFISCEYDSTTRTYHVWLTNSEYKFSDVAISGYDDSGTFKLWIYTWQIPSGQTASVLNEALPKLANGIETLNSNALTGISFNTNVNKSMWSYGGDRLDGTHYGNYGFDVCDGKSIINENGLKLGDISTQAVYTSEILNASNCTYTPLGGSWVYNYSEAVQHFDLKFNYNFYENNEFSLEIYYYYDNASSSTSKYIYGRYNSGTLEMHFGDGNWSSDYSALTSSIQGDTNLDITITSDGIEYIKGSGGTEWLSHIYCGNCLYYGSDHQDSPFSSMTDYHNSIGIYEAVETLFEKYEDGDYVETSATTSAVTSGSTSVITSGGVYQQMGGLKLVKLTQSAYDALSPNYDSNTLYIIKD